MKKRNAFVRFVSTVTLLVVAVGCQDGTIPPGLVGEWTGYARNTHITPTNAPMPIVLKVSADGTVSGTLGTAVVTNGTIRKNRGKLGRLLNLKSDFLIYADLEGSLVAEKDIRYKGIFINMNVENDDVVAAGFTTTHSRYGTPIAKQGLVRGRVSIKKTSAAKE